MLDLHRISEMMVMASERALRVLVVEDHTDTRDSTAALLRIEGHDVHIAKHGDVALKMAETHPPDVVLLDLGLPGLDGYQVAQALRSMEPTQRPYIIAISGYAMSHDVKRSTEAGIDMHLAKPADPMSLLVLLRRLKARNKPAAE